MLNICQQIIIIIIVEQMQVIYHKLILILLSKNLLTKISEWIHYEDGAYWVVSFIPTAGS
jgi:hypothetical protein